MRFSFPQPLRGLLVVPVLLLLSGGNRLFAQAPAWQWATSPGIGEGRSTTVDAAGNVYVTGFFRGTATFGSVTLTSAGGTDLFVAKLTSSSTYQWAVRAGGSGAFENGTGVAVDGNGNVVVTGSFDSPTITFGATTLTSAGSGDVYVAQLTPAGAWQWAVRAGGSGHDYGSDVAVAGSGHVVVTGVFNGTATIGNSTFTTAADGGFVAQLTSAGVWQWATPILGDAAYGNDVAVASSGHVVVTGQFRGTATIGDSTFTTGMGFFDLFVAQLTPTGAWQWVTRAGGTESDYGSGVTVDATGHVVVTGVFASTVTFGATTLTSAGDEDVFVARLTPTGAWQWANRVGAAGYDQGHSVAVDGSGHLIVGGRFSGTVALGATILTSVALTDVFVARLTSAGTWQWAASAGASGQDRGYAVAVDGSGQVVLTGSFTSAITFGSTTLTSSSSLPAIFLAHLGTATGQPDATGQPLLTLAPNPARTTVQLTGAIGSVATLLDGCCRLVSTIPLTPTGAATLDVRALPAGLYLLRAGGAIRRLVVE